MFLFCLVFAMSLCASVYMCFAVTCWERADLLVLVCGVLLWACHFPIGILGQVWYLIVSIPDHCTLTYFHIVIIMHSCGSCNFDTKPLRYCCYLHIFQFKIYIVIFDWFLHFKYSQQPHHLFAYQWLDNVKTDKYVCKIWSKYTMWFKSYEHFN